MVPCPHGGGAGGAMLGFLLSCGVAPNQSGTAPAPLPSLIGQFFNYTTPLAFNVLFYGNPPVFNLNPHVCLRASTLEIPDYKS